MLEWLESISTRIADGTLLPDSYYSDLDKDEALNKRDSDKVFVKEWMVIYQQVRSLTGIGQEEAKLIESIRKDSFFAVSNATGHHEIASYVSDDLELILLCKVAGIKSDLIESLWKEYDQGKFPTPTV